MPTAIEFQNVSKQYRLGLVSTKTLSHDLNRWWTTQVLKKEDPYLKIGETNDRTTKGSSDYVWALRDINLKIEEGDVVGFIGKNGAGKSTLLKLLSRVTAPSTGTIKARGRIASLLEVGTGFHPEMTGRENIYMNGAILGMTKREISSKLDEIIDFSGCERYIDTPVKRYSSGMMVRLGFAVAAHLDPEILVVDEVLAVGDAEFQKKAIGKMQDISTGQGRTVLFVSHNMAAIRTLCKKGVIMQNGMIQKTGSADECVNKYLYDEYNSKRIFDLKKDISIPSKHFLLYGILLNGKDPQQINIRDVGNIINIQFSGYVDIPMTIQFIAMIYDKNAVKVGTYSTINNGHVDNVSAGDFLLEESFSVPENLTNGEYRLRIELVQRNVEYLLIADNLCSIVKNSMISPYTGVEYTIQNTGYFAIN